MKVWSAFVELLPPRFYNVEEIGTIQVPFCIHLGQFSFILTYLRILGYLLASFDHPIPSHLRNYPLVSSLIIFSMPYRNMHLSSNGTPLIIAPNAEENNVFDKAFSTDGIDPEEWIDWMRWDGGAEQEYVFQRLSNP